MKTTERYSAKDVRVRKILELIPLPAVIHLAGVAVYANRLMYEMLGLNEEEGLEERSLLDFVHPEDQANVQLFLNQDLGPKDHQGRFSLKMKVEGGNYRSLDTNSAPVKYEQKDCRLLIIYDYSEKEIIRNKLEIKDFLLERLSETLPDFVAVYELPARRKIFENSSLLNRLGYNNLEISISEFRFLQEKTHPADLENTKNIESFILQGAVNDSCSVEYRLLSAADEWVWFRSRVRAINTSSEKDSAIWVFLFTQDISQEKEMERVLRESKLFAEKIAGAVPSLLTIYSLDSETIDYTNFSKDFLGFDKAGFYEGPPAKSIADQLGLSGESKLRLKKMQDTEVLSQVIKLKDAQAAERQLLSRIKVFSRDETLQVKQLICSLIDITEEKAVRQKLGRSELLYKTIAGSIPNGFVLAYDLDYKITFASGELLKSMGIGDSVFPDDSIVAAERYDYPWMGLWSAFRKTLEGKNSKIEKTLQGHELQMFFQPLREEYTEEIYGGLLISYDVAEIRQTRVALDLSEETRQAILNAIPDLVFKMRKDGRILDYYFNRSESDEIPWEQLKARTIGEFMSAEETTQILHTIEKCIQSGGVLHHEFQTFNLGKEYWLELRFSKLNDQEAIVIVRDITDQKKTALSLDEKLAEISLKNIELERYITSNSELEKFAYITSHDLKEPVRSIIGFTQLLQKKGADQFDEEQQEYLNNIISGARRMSSLINGLLDYSRINTQGKAFEEMEVEEILSKVKMDLLQIIEESKAVVLYDELPRLYGDRLQIRQLFQNIITNSIKFRTEAPPIIQIACTAENGYWQFRVQDNGIGFDMKYKDKLFALFTRLHTSDQYPGTGIGLALCKKIIDRHNGRIWLESSPGKGTAVSFTIPA